MDKAADFMCNKRVVVSTRPSAPGDVESAQRHDVELVDCPAYYYRWITPSQFVTDTVISEPHPDAWVFTSRRGVEGWWRIWKELADSAEIPPVYVVGEKTRGAFEDNFPKSEIRMADEHNATELGLRMVRDGIGTVAHFCSVDRRSELREICRKFNVEMTEVEVYRSTSVTDPEPVKGPVDAVLFFSPNGVSEFQRLYGLPEGDWQAIAVGPTTAEAVKRVTGRKPRIAPSPSFEEMINLI